MRRFIFSIAIFSTSLVGCGKNEQSHSGSASELSYIQWSLSTVRSATLADARKDEVRVCLSGSVSASDFDRSKEWSKRAVLTWLRTVKVLDNQVTSNITYTCDNYDLIFRLINGDGRSYASPSAINVYMTRPYGTWTHELGHALAALGDTYAGSSAGQCQSGQPQSLMCWGAYGPRKDPDEFSTLWPDDIAGVQGNYTKLFGASLTPPDWADEINLEAPLDVENPWPEATAQVRYLDDQLSLNFIPAAVIRGSADAVDL